MTSGGEIISRTEQIKINLRTLERAAKNFEGDFLVQMNCRYIEIPVEITIIEADEIYPGF